MPCSCQVEDNPVTRARSNNGTRRDPIEVVAEVISTSICSECPSASRWAEEMLREQQMVNEAKSRGLDVTSFVEQAHGGPRRLKDQMQKTGHQDLAKQTLMQTVPERRWRKYWRYLKAKIPHVLGFRLNSLVVKARQEQCLHGVITCGKCGSFANWSHRYHSFVCECGEKYFDPSQKIAVGQVCPFVQVQNGGLYCRACGCGFRRDANLAIKTQMVYATCVKDSWPNERKIKWQPVVFSM